MGSRDLAAEMRAWSVAAAKRAEENAQIEAEKAAAQREAAKPRHARRKAAESAQQSCVQTIGVTPQISEPTKTVEKSPPAGENARPKRDFEQLREHKSNFRRLQLISRLEDEAAEDLLPSIRRCQEPIWLRCMSCGQRHVVPRKCDQKWCPCCVQHLANIRAAKLYLAVIKFKWPLFVTLTMQNSDDPDDVRKLRQAFGRLRAKKLWKNNVTGGVAAIEVTNIGNGWHPHLHAVIDCRWLADKTREPARNESREAKAAAFQAAGEELQRHWTKCLRQTTPASIKVKRAKLLAPKPGADPGHSDCITREIVKYAVKGDDLLESADPIAPLIRVLQKTRLLTTFGSVYGLSAELEELQESERDRSGGCCEFPEMVPLEIADYLTSKDCRSNVYFSPKR